MLKVKSCVHRQDAEELLFYLPLFLSLQDIGPLVEPVVGERSDVRDLLVPRKDIVEEIKQKQL